MNNKRFHYLKDGKPVGPISFQELQQIVAAKQISPKDMVWPEGAPNWIPASQVEGLFATAPPPPAPPPPPPAPVPPAPPAQASAAPSPVAAGEPKPTTNAAAAGTASAAPSSTAPRPKTDPIAVLKFMLTSVSGAAGLAFIGFLFLCCGGCGIAYNFSGERAPTPITIADLEKEKESKLPDRKWLEITDGHMFLQGMYPESTKGKDGEKTYVAYYVPLVSKSVNEQWTADFIGSKGSSKYSYSKARVILKISPSQLKNFSDVPEGDKPVTKISQEKSPVKGVVVGSFKALPKHVMEKLAEQSKEQETDRMIVLNYGEEIQSSYLSLCFGLFLWLVALPWFVPLGIVLFKRLNKAKPASPAPASGVA